MCCILFSGSQLPTLITVTDEVLLFCDHNKVYIWLR